MVSIRCLGCKIPLLFPEISPACKHHLWYHNTITRLPKVERGYKDTDDFYCIASFRYHRYAGEWNAEGMECYFGEYHNDASDLGSNLYHLVCRIQSTQGDWPICDFDEG